MYDAKAILTNKGDLHALREIPEVNIEVKDTEELAAAEKPAWVIIQIDGHDKELAEEVVCASISQKFLEAIYKEYPNIDETENIDEEMFKYLINKYYNTYTNRVDDILEIIHRHGDYKTVKELKEYCGAADEKKMWYLTEMRKSFNQQVCLVEYKKGYTDKYNMQANAVWFTIGSIGFDWSEIIYNYLNYNYTIKKDKNDMVYIQRNAKNNIVNAGDAEYSFYRLADGSVAYAKPLEECIKLLQQGIKKEPAFQVDFTTATDIVLSKLSEGYSKREIEEDSRITFSSMELAGKIAMAEKENWAEIINYKARPTKLLKAVAAAVQKLNRKTDKIESITNLCLEKAEADLCILYGVVHCKGEGAITMALKVELPKYHWIEWSMIATKIFNELDCVVEGIES